MIFSKKYQKNTGCCGIKTAIEFDIFIRLISFETHKMNYKKNVCKYPYFTCCSNAGSDSKFRWKIIRKSFAFIFELDSNFSNSDTVDDFSNKT